MKYDRSFVLVSLVRFLRLCSHFHKKEMRNDLIYTQLLIG